jgi:hypothetical protein
LAFARELWGDGRGHREFTPLESHRRHKKEVDGPIPVSNCLKNC